MLYEYDGLCRMLAALFNLAHRDAAQGSEDALQWLDTVAPTWRDTDFTQECKVSAVASIRVLSLNTERFDSCFQE